MARFSIYDYQALKKQLDGIAELRFIFTSQIFIKEKPLKAKREFYIPRLEHERSLYGARRFPYNGLKADLYGFMDNIKGDCSE